MGTDVESVKRFAVQADLPDKWQTFANGIAVGRYTDSEFQALEHEKLWSRVWQVACRVDAVPEVNDFQVYDVGERSALVVRVSPEKIKAYFNFCPHRGTALGEGSGCFEEGNIICPFHGWRWNVEGENQFILAKDEFKGGQLKSSDVPLKEMHCREFLGFVFVNFSSNPPSFDEFIAPIKDKMKMMAVEHMRNYWWKRIPVEANWKCAQEAFHEGYHVPATHPQLETAAADFIYGSEIADDFPFQHYNIAYDAFEGGHGRFYAGKTGSVMQGKVSEKSDAVPTEDPVDIMADRLQLLVDGMDAQVLQKDVDLLRGLKGQSVPEGSSVGGEFMRVIYEDAAKRKRALPDPTPEAFAMWGGEIFLFPNVCLLFSAGNMMVYRALPVGNDPNRCTFEIMSTTTLGEEETPTRAVCEDVTDSYDPDQVRLIPRQDLGNIPRMQKGMRSGGMSRTWLADYNEKIILNMHQELDRYLLDQV